MSPDLHPRRDTHGHVRVFWDSPKGRRLIGVVKRVSTGPRGGKRWVAMASALSEPLPGEYATQGEACEALRVRSYRSQLQGL